MSITIVIDGLSKERAAEYLLRAPRNGTVEVTKDKSSLSTLYRVSAIGLLKQDVLAFLGCPEGEGKERSR